jgi:hypothetical protein
MSFSYDSSIADNQSSPTLQITDIGEMPWRKSVNFMIQLPPPSSIKSGDEGILHLLRDRVTALTRVDTVVLDLERSSADRRRSVSNKNARQRQRGYAQVESERPRYREPCRRRTSMNKAMSRVWPLDAEHDVLHVPRIAPEPIRRRREHRVQVKLKRTCGTCNPSTALLQKGRRINLAPGTNTR